MPVPVIVPMVVMAMIVAVVVFVVMIAIGSTFVTREEFRFQFENTVEIESIAAEHGV